MGRGGDNFKLCWKCGEKIYFSIEHMTESGEHIPLDYFRPGQPHDCPADHEKEYDEYEETNWISDPIQCRTCESWIYFDSDVRSEDTGKMRPLDLDTEKPRDCCIKLLEDLQKNLQERDSGKLHTPVFAASDQGGET